MDNIKKSLWLAAGMLFLGLAYIGLVTPGVPWSTPTVAAAYCFSKGSKRWHDWIMRHKIFGPFLRNWSEKRVFPVYGKWAMMITMDISLFIVYLTTHNWKLVASIAAGLFLVVVWAWRFPSSVEDYDRRKAAGEKIGWFK